MAMPQGAPWHGHPAREGVMARMATPQGERPPACHDILEMNGLSVDDGNLKKTHVIDTK